MTTTLGSPLVVKTVSAACNGQCGGTITLTTDVIHSAYAVVTETDRGYVEADTDAVLRDRDADTIEVSCPSEHHLSENRCNGSVTFDRDALNEGEWRAATPIVIAYMHRMDVA